MIARENAYNMLQETVSVASSVPLVFISVPERFLAVITGNCLKLSSDQGACLEVNARGMPVNSQGNYCSLPKLPSPKQLLIRSWWLNILASSAFLGDNFEMFCVLFLSILLQNSTPVATQCQLDNYTQLTGFLLVIFFKSPNSLAFLPLSGRVSVPFFCGVVTASTERVWQN